MAGKKVERQLSIFINDREVVNSLGGINREIAKVNGQLRNLNASEADYAQRSTELRQTLTQLTQRQQQFRQELYSTNEAVQENNASMADARNIASNIFNGIKNRDFDMVRDGFGGIREGIKGSYEAAKGFVSTGIGASVAALVGIGAGAKALFDYNNEAERLNKILRGLGVSDSALSDVRSEIEATAETYNKEFTEIAQKAKSLSVSFGISMSAANEAIARGLADGGEMNDEFLDSLGEYDEFFSKAGYSAQEFVNIVNQGFDLGIYTDKLPDALKEADLSLREQTTATRDALVNAFGASFTDDVLGRVRNGSTTTKEALEEISAEAEKVGLTAQQAAQLTADVFRGAGEDAGGALNVLKAVGMAANREMSNAAKGAEELRTANERLNKSQAALFEIEGYGSLWTKIKVIGINALDGILASLRGVVNFMANAPAKGANLLISLFNNVLDGAQSLARIMSPILSKIGVDVKGLIGSLDSLKKQKFEIKAVVSVADDDENKGDGTAKAVKATTDTVRAEVEAQLRLLQQRKERMEALGQDTYNIQRQMLLRQMQLHGVETDEYRKLNNDLIKLQREHGAKLAEEQEKLAQKSMAAADKLAKDLYERQVAIAKANLNYILSANESKLESGQQLTQQLVAEETIRLQKVREAKLQELAVEKSTNDGAIALKRSLGIELTAADVEYLSGKQSLELQYEQDTQRLKDQLQAQYKASAAERMMIEKELEIAQAETDGQAQSIRLQQQYDTELNQYKEMLKQKKIGDTEYKIFKDALDKKYRDMERQREIGQIQSILGSYSSIANSIGELFGQSKELALAQAAINGAQAITGIWAQWPKWDGGFQMYAAIAAAGFSVAAQIKNIQKQKAPKTPKFFFGGHTGTNAMYHDEYGPVTGVVHKNEYVMPEWMTQSPRYANVIQWLENERVRKNGFATGGMVSDNGPAPVPALNQGQPVDDLRPVLVALLHRLDNPVPPVLNIGYNQAKKINDLNNERSQSEQNGILNS